MTNRNAGKDIVLLDEKGVEAAMRRYLRPSCYDNPGPRFGEEKERIEMTIKAYLKAAEQKAVPGDEELVEVNKELRFALSQAHKVFECELNKMQEIIRQHLSGNGWKPIKSAPKDGTHIITLVKGFLPTIGFWENSEWVNDRLLLHRQLYIKPHEEYMDMDAYLPTHWQPLPSCPTE